MEYRTFLDFNERHNGKTFYYLRLAVFHNIPVLTNSEANKINFYNECYKISGANINRSFPIYNIRDRYDRMVVQCMMDNGVKIIVDSKDVELDVIENLEFSLSLHCGGGMTDNEIRDMILTDLSEGKTYYENS